MANGKYILVDEELQQAMLNEIRQLKELLLKNAHSTTPPEDDVIMDTADLVRYLKVDRKTIYNYRKKGLRDGRKDKGRLFFWKSDVDTFFGKNK